MKYVGNPIPITTANGEVKIHAQVYVYVKELGIFVWAYVLDCECSVLSLGMLCDDEGFTYQWVPNTPPTLTRDGFRVICYPSHNVPVIFPAALQAEGDLEEDDMTDIEIPSIVGSSSEDEGWEIARGRRTKRRSRP